MRMARCVVWTVLLVATGLPVLGAQTAKEAVPFRITGTVVNDRNGEPVPFCHMSASLVVTARGPGQRLGGEGGRGLRQEATEADADAKGRFVLKVPSEGRYRLSASARGFRVQMLEAHGTFSTAVALTRALPTHAVMFRVDEDATISGEVTDEAGEGVRQAQVKLYAVADPNRTPEERRVQMSTMAITDDQGHYELPAVAAGAYKLSVSARPWYATPNSPAPSGATAPSPDPSLDVVYPVTWYPSTDDATRGERIVVKYGEKKQMDFRLSPTATAHVRVSVPIEQPQSEGFRAGSLGGRPRLEQVLPDGLTDTATMQVNVSGGELEFGGLAPGTYRMVRPGTSTDGPQTVSIIHVAAGGTVTREAELREIAVTIRVDGDPTVVAGQVSLIDTATGQVVGRGRLIAPVHTPSMIDRKHDVLPRNHIGELKAAIGRGLRPTFEDQVRRVAQRCRNKQNHRTGRRLAQPGRYSLDRGQSSRHMDKKMWIPVHDLHHPPRYLGPRRGDPGQE